MINPFIIKRWAAFILSGLITTIAFYIGLVMFNFLYALIFMLASVIIMAVIGSMMINNPFRQILEGKGILGLILDSTGVIRPFVMSVLPPYIEGSIDGLTKKDVYDREAVFSLATPKKAGKIQQRIDREGNMYMDIALTEEEYNKGRFGFFHFPCVIYNDQIKSLITKDFLSNEEKTLFADHSVLYLNRKMEELTSAMLNFGRYVVEQFNPRKFKISGGMIAIILIVAAIIVLVLLAPKLFPALSSAAGSIGSGAGNAAGAIQKVT